MGANEMLKRLYEVWKPFRWLALAALALNILTEGLALVGPYLYGRLIDSMVERADMTEIFKVIGLIFAITVANYIVIEFIASTIKFKHIQIPLKRRISALSLDALMRFSIGQHLNENSGVKHSTITRGESALDSLFGVMVYNLIPTLLEATVTTIFLFILSPIIGAIVLSGLLIYVGTAMLVNRHFKKPLKEYYEKGRDNDKLQHEILRNIPLIKINSREKLSSEEFLKDHYEYTEYSKNMWMKYVKISYSRDLIVIFTRIAVMLVGAYLVHRGDYGVGFLLVIFSWSAMAFDRINWIAKQQREFLENWTRAKEYFRMISIKPEVTVRENPIKLNKIRGAIDVQDLWFSYPSCESDEEVGDGEKLPETENRPVLKGVDLRINPGEAVAIVGPSGAGKSTLISLLIRAYDPEKGKIMIDGHDLRDVDLKGYREALGIVPQDVHLFDKSLRYNILVGMNGYAKDVTEKEIDEIARLSCIDQFRHRLSDGYDTLIGERGVKLSGGERQRVAIARALMKKPQALIFDEATSNLDTENETLIRESIKRASRGKTTIIIAHRFSTVQAADRIIVMDQGRVVGQGTHNELFENCGVYRRLVENQTVMIGA